MKLQRNITANKDALQANGGGFNDSTIQRFNLFPPMTRTTKHALAIVTAPDLPTARKLTTAALRAKLVACANLIPKLESHYWWQGKLEKSSEVLILFKTASSHLAKLEQLILRQHPYDTPEFIVLPLTGGNERYLAWVQNSIQH